MAAYVIAFVEVDDAEAYSLYTAQTPGLIEAAGGRFVVRGGDPGIKEGVFPGTRCVVVEFQDRAAAEAFYHSASYQEIIPLRIAASKGALCIVDGV